jgi:hypothetical protein
MHEHLQSMTNDIGRGERPSARELDEARANLRATVAALIEDKRKLTAERDTAVRVRDLLIATMVESSPHALSLCLRKLRETYPDDFARPGLVA